MDSFLVICFPASWATQMNAPCGLVVSDAQELEFRCDFIPLAGWEDKIVVDDRHKREGARPNSPSYQYLEAPMLEAKFLFLALFFCGAVSQK
jgi:hypothetical protein